MSNSKPHRRMSLTTPTVPTPATNEEAATNNFAVSEEPTTLEAKPKEVISGEAVSAEDVVRVMAYLAPNEAEVLDGIWFRLRRLPSRPSKSDVIRAALLLAADDEEKLSSMLTQQQTNTLSRQRARKLRPAKSA